MTTGPGQRRPDESMTLLTSMLERPLDAGYQEAADRRVAAGLPPATPTRTAAVVIMMVLTGFLFAVGAQALRPRPTAAASVKSELVSRIESLQVDGQQQESQIAALRKEVGDLDALRLRQAGAADLTDTIRDLEIAAGVVAMTGPGLTLTMDDAPSAGRDPNPGDRPSSGFDSGRVTSSDLQIVVNGLWGVGAEAIAINGHRLTSTAAIRFAGQAIIVNFRPITPPYVITVLGDAARMQQLFEPSFAGVYLAQLQDQFGITSDLAASDRLTVPGDSVTLLTAARRMQGRAATATDSATTGAEPGSSETTTSPSTVTPETNEPDQSFGATR
jgi:uncharacterized protein YlxW (UPF0749 family)